MKLYFSVKGFSVNFDNIKNTLKETVVISAPLSCSFFQLIHHAFADFIMTATLAECGVLGSHESTIQ